MTDQPIVIEDMEAEAEEAFERFLGILRGIQLLHDPNQRPLVEASVYKPRRILTNCTFWCIKVRAPKQIGTMTYCFVLRTAPPGIHLTNPGDILAVKAGQPDAKHVVGSIFGDNWPMSPPPDYFLRFCGKDRVGEHRVQRDNDRKVREHREAIKKHDPSSLWPRRASRHPLTGQSFRPRNPPPANRKSPAAHGFDHMVLHAKLKEALPNGTDDIDWLDDID
jgi:hypothetical protein